MRRQRRPGKDGAAFVLCSCDLSEAARCAADGKAHSFVTCRLAAIDQPAKPYGFWNSDSSNAKYRTNLDPGINSLPGRACTVDLCLLVSRNAVSSHVAWALLDNESEWCCAGRAKTLDD